MVTATNVSYEWYRNGELIQTDPVLELELQSDPELVDVAIYEVMIYNNNTGCFIEDGFASKGYWTPPNSSTSRSTSSLNSTNNKFSFTTFS